MSQLKNRTLSVPLIILSFALSLSFLYGELANTAYATSDFDDTYHATNQIEIAANNYYGHTCSAQDVTNTWADAILNSGNQIMIDSFNNKVSWAVTESFTDYGNMDYTAVHVNWSETQAQSIFTGYSFDNGTTWYRMLDFNAPTIHGVTIVRVRMVCG